MEFKTRASDGVIIVDLKGPITLGQATEALRELIRDLVNDGKARIVLNLAEVSFLDSSGIAVLVDAYQAVVRAGGKLKLLNLTRNIHDQFEITKLSTVFDITNDEKAAIASFGPESTAQP